MQSNQKPSRNRRWKQRVRPPITPCSIDRGGGLDPTALYIAQKVPKIKELLCPLQDAHEYQANNDLVFREIPQVYQNGFYNGGVDDPDEKSYPLPLWRAGRRTGPL
jgi:hypothetical protein